MWVWIAGNFCDLASEGQQNGPEWTTSPFSETHFVRWENMFQFSPSKALQRKADKILTAVIPIWPQPKVKQDLVWPSLPSWIYHRNTGTIKLQYFTESFRSFDAGLGNSDRTRNRNRNRCIIGDDRTNERTNGWMRPMSLFPLSEASEEVENVADSRCARASTKMKLAKLNGFGVVWLHGQLMSMSSWFWFLLPPMYFVRTCCSYICGVSEHLELELNGVQLALDDSRANWG